MFSMYKNFIFSTLIWTSFIQSVEGWCLRTKFAAKTSIQSLDFTPDGQYIITGQSSGRVMLWKSDTLQILKISQFAAKLWATAVSKNGLYIAISGESINLDIIDVATFNLVRQINTAQVKVYSTDFRIDSQTLLTCGDDKKIKIYNVSTGVLINSTSVTNTPYTCKYTDNNWIVVAGLAFTQSYNALLTKVYFALRLTDIFYCITPVPGSVYSIAVSTTGLLLQSDITSTGTDQALTGSSGPLYGCDYSLDSLNFAVAGTNNQVYLFNAKSRANTIETTLLTNSQGIIKSIKFSQDSSILLAGDQNGTVHYFQRICNMCPSGTYPYQNQCKYCANLLTGCSICNNATACVSCMSGYYINRTTFLCESCADKIQGCANCNSSSNCTSCIPGYYKAGLICTRCLTAQFGCLQCKGPLICEQCDKYNYLNAGICTKCSTLSNCLFCNSSAYCVECLQGYFSNFGVCTSCNSATNPNCLQCQSSANCSVCMDGYRLGSSNFCQECAPQCMFCNTTNHCFQCVTQMFLNSSSLCQYCVSPCQTCTSLTYCLSCQQSYFLSSAGVCTMCSAPCLSCNSTTRCQSCFVGYYLDSSHTCQFCKVLYPNCRQCRPTVCTSCQIGFVLSAGSCSRCSISIIGCMICDNSTICAQCLTGFYKTGLTGVDSCKVCQSGCMICISQSNCSLCKPGFYKSGNSCFLCVQNCLSCNSSLSSQCYSCTERYYLSSTIIGTCLSCSVMPNCIACHNASYCLGCSLGYYLNSSIACIACTPPCVTCSNSSTNCLTCDLGFYRYLTGTGTGACQQCIYGCSQCTTSASICVNCIAGYYHDNMAKSCIKCYVSIAGCDACSNSTYCVSCSSGYYPLLGVCQICTSVIPKCLKCNVLGDICSLCDYGFALSADQTSCISCSVSLPNCQQCTSSTFCQTCDSGFLQSAGSCIPCPTGCLSCFNTSICEVCFDSYILSSAKTCQLCENIMPGCQSCSSSSICKDCLVGYYPNESTCLLCSNALQGCQVCINSATCIYCSIYYQLQTNSTCAICSNVYSNCQICGNTSLGCLQCQMGYYLSMGACLSCNYNLSEGCQRCWSNNTCVLCMNGYYLDSSSLCQKCDATYPNCIYCNQTQCQVCQSGYYLLNGICSQCPGLGCEVCSILNSTQCVTCNSKYYLLNSQCLLCTTAMNQCLECLNLTTCIECASGFFINLTNKCQICSSRYPGCSKCTSSGCYDCLANFFLNSISQCQSCNNYIVGCSFCISQSICLSCQVGYYFANQTCQHCSLIYGCLNCINDSICIQCQQSYYLSVYGNKCYRCVDQIKNCYACFDSSTCISCEGHYQLVGNLCKQIEGEVIKKVANLDLKSEYENQTCLKHSLYALDFLFRVVEVDWFTKTQLSLIDKNYQQIVLQLLQVQYGSVLSQIIFYTDNPINDELQKSIQDMPLLKPRQQSTRLLQESQTTSLLIDYKLKLMIDESIAQQIMPALTQVGDLYLTYSLSDTQFYNSYIRNIKHYHYLFGLVITISIFIMFTAKLCWFVPKSLDKGSIVPHIFALKCGGTALYPSFAQYISYCYGFMTADIPWLNSQLGHKLGKQGQLVPGSYGLYYMNLSLVSTYFLATITIMCLWLILSIVGYLKPSVKSTIQGYKSFIYNFFIVGVTVAGCISLQGVLINKIDDGNTNTVFYVVGIVIYVSILVQIVYSTYTSLCKKQQEIAKDKIYEKSMNQSRNKSFNKQNQSHSFFQPKQQSQNRNMVLVVQIRKIRIFVKSTLLSLAYIAPLYFISIIFCIQIAVVIFQFYLLREVFHEGISPKSQLFEHSLANIALLCLILVPDALAGLIFVSILIIFVLVIQIYKAYEQYTQFQRLEQNDTNLNQTDYNYDEAIKKEVLNDSIFFGMEQNKQKQKISQEIFYQSSIQNKKFVKKGKNKDSLSFSLKQLNEPNVNIYPNDTQPKIKKQKSQTFNF